RTSTTSRRALATDRQRAGASGRSPARGARPCSWLASRDGPPEDYQRRLERQLANLLGAAVFLGDDGVVPLLELGAEGANRRLHAGRVLGGPLRERRVPGLVHPDESRHCGASW